MHHHHYKVLTDPRILIELLGESWSGANAASARQRVQFLNHALTRLWPSMKQATEASIRAVVCPMLSNAVAADGAVLSTLRLTRLDLGHAVGSITLTLAACQ
jgi:hypothetical protein